MRLSELRCGRGEILPAWELARHALSTDATDAEANLAYAAINDSDGRLADAIDGYGWAARSPVLRGLANARLAALHARNGDWWRASLFAQRAADSGARAGGRLLAFSARQQGERTRASALLERLEQADPLDHLVRAERWILTASDADRRALVAGIRNELPFQT